MMRPDFCAFILTHGRPDKVRTYGALRRAGYTGKIFIVIDDEDETAEQYKAKFGEQVLMFSKGEVAMRIDEGDNFGKRGVILYARNVCFELAEEVGCTHFIELDDDYSSFGYRFGRLEPSLHKTMDKCLEAMVQWLDAIHALTVTMSQGGDHMGTTAHRLTARRKAMNAFVCSTEKPFLFRGTINEDVNTYCELSRMGELFFTVMPIQLTQQTTQASKGGMTEVYLSSGTYVKSFYTVMYCPSAAKVGILRDPQNKKGGRWHHKLNWHNIAPKILREEHKKPDAPRS